MAVTFVSVNNAAGESAGNTTTAGTVAITPTMPASTVNGQTRVLVTEAATGVSGTTPTGWTALFKDTVIGSGTVANNTGLRYLSCYYRDKDATWSAMPSFPLTSGTNLGHWIGAVALNKTSTAYTWNTPTFTTPGTDYGTADTAHSATTGSLTTHAGGFLLASSVLNAFTAFSAGAMTQSGATLGTVTERCDGGIGTGFDVEGSVYTCSVTAGATAAIVFTATIVVAAQGGTIVVEQTEAAPSNAGQFFPFF